MSRYGEVFPALVDEAIKQSDCIQAVYSHCIKIWWHQTGKLDVGFSSKKMVSWIKENRQNVFDKDGKKQEER